MFLSCCYELKVHLTLNEFSFQSSHDIEVIYVGQEQNFLDTTYQILHWAPVSIYYSLKNLVVFFPEDQWHFNPCSLVGHLSVLDSGDRRHLDRHLWIVVYAYVIFSVWSVLPFWQGAFCLYAASAVTSTLGCTSKIFALWHLIPCFILLYTSQLL